MPARRGISRRRFLAAGAASAVAAAAHGAAVRAQNDDDVDGASGGESVARVEADAGTDDAGIRRLRCVVAERPDRL